MRCPNCEVDCREGVSECPACGVNFEKWRLRQDQLAAQRALKAAVPAPAPAPASAVAGGLSPTAILIVIVVAAGGAWQRYRSAEKTPPPAPKSSSVCQAPGGSVPAVAAPADIAMIPDGGYSRLQPLLEQMQSEGSGVGVSFSLEDIKGPFRAGFVEIDYGFNNKLTPEETSLPPIPVVQGVSTEKGGLKCRKDDWEYLERHPNPGEGYAECCKRNTKSKTSSWAAGDMMYKMTKPDGYADTWSCYSWQTKRKTWSPYAEEDFLRGFEFYAEKHFGLQKQIEAQQQADQAFAKIGASGGAPSATDHKARILGGSHLKFVLEGALYRLELERRRLAQ